MQDSISRGCCQKGNMQDSISRGCCQKGIMQNSISWGVLLKVKYAELNMLCTEISAVGHQVVNL